MSSSTTRHLLLALVSFATLSAGSSQAALRDLDNHTLSTITGQAGITLRIDLQANIGQVAWNDDGGSVSLRNVKVDNGCVNPGDCPNGAGGSFAYGPAQLGLSVPLLGINVPTLQVDVISGNNGQQQIQLTLPDLTGINQQLIANDFPAQRIRVRVEGDLYIGDSSIGKLAVRDITDLRGTFRVWGH
ncbi:hypothetical protein NVV93_01275 [Pseudomonas sp. LS44]|uniref:DUF6160 family protein n=1 Tax=Pseudomonas sp. LS44 TaxID=1357074 RepID=UPI00215A4862|nr:DUF6160 family protein [Pseudomonas sp. LS44]UVE18062.1 hypothetical protein NVV93_01275 [Pseudomonas sp. LS44]